MIRYDVMSVVNVLFQFWPEWFQRFRMQNNDFALSYNEYPATPLNPLLLTS